MKKRGFTLIELLVVMAIIGILAGVVGTTFVNSQRRGKDAQRKSDLKNMAHALELFYNDYNKYPLAEGGKIMACSYQVNNNGTEEATSCDWGEDTFKGVEADGITLKTTYMEKVPADPSYPLSYYYYQNPGGDRQKYQLYAHLDNTEDKNIINGINIACGASLACNFSMTSSNTNPTE